MGRANEVREGRVVIVEGKAAFTTWGEEDFLGRYKNFQDEIGGIENFQLIYRGDVKFSLDPC